MICPFPFVVPSFVPLQFIELLSLKCKTQTASFLFSSCDPHHFQFGAFSLAIFPANPSARHRLASGGSHGPNNSAHPSLYQALHSSFTLSLSSLPFSFPFLLLSNCQAALGPARHLRHRLLILLDHRKKHVCL